MTEQQHKRIGVNMLAIKDGWVKHYCTIKITLTIKKIDKILLWKCPHGYFVVGSDTKKLTALGYKPKMLGRLLIVIVPDEDINAICLRFSCITVPFQMMGCDIVCNNKPRFYKNNIGLIAVIMKTFLK